MQAIIDRFEEEYAILESDQGSIAISISLLPEDCREGDAVYLNEYETWMVDQEATKARKEYMKNLASKLWKKP